MYGAGAAWRLLLWLKPEPPEVDFYAWSRSRPNLAEAGLGSGTSEPPKKVAAPQHWFEPIVTEKSGLILCTYTGTVFPLEVLYLKHSQLAFRKN